MRPRLQDISPILPSSTAVSLLNVRHRKMGRMSCSRLGKLAKEKGLSILPVCRVIFDNVRHCSVEIVGCIAPLAMFIILLEHLPNDF